MRGQIMAEREIRQSYGNFYRRKRGGQNHGFQTGNPVFQTNSCIWGKIRYKNCPFLLFLGPVYDIIEKMGVFILRGTYDKTDSPAHG